MTSFKLTLNNLFDFLTKDKYLPQLQKETSQIYLLLKTSSLELALFFRIISNAELLQIVTYLPIKVNEECKNDLARLLLKLNNDIDMPGFSLNEPSNLVFFRLVLPCTKKMVCPLMLKQFIDISTNAVVTFIDSIRSISSGKITFDSLMKKNL